jgi:hypothetical protein
MERRMLKALQWRVNPPIAMDFCRKFLEIVPQNVLNSKSRKQILELAESQIDMSIVHYDFCTKGASHIAFASLLNAVESIHDKDQPNLCSCIESLVSQLVRIKSHFFIDLRERLLDAISHQPISELLQKEVSNKPLRSSTCSSNSGSSHCMSPVSVHTL